MSVQAAIGIDIGGTRIKAGIVTSEGEISALRIVPTQASGGREALLASLRTIIAELQAAPEGAALCGIGVGTAGYVDRSGTVAAASDNLPGWQGTPLRELLSGWYGMPAAVVNDVNAMALGEAWRGGGPSPRHFLCVALGTGVGGAVICDGALYGGRDGYAGGFGHQVIVAGGHPCNCGRHGCWEQYASARALMRFAEEAGGRGEPWGESAQKLFAAARAGYAAADEAVGRFAGYVAEGIMNLLYLFNPPAVVIGGGVTAQGEFLFDRIRARVRAGMMFNYVTPEVPIVPASLGDSAAVYGAAGSLFMAQGILQRPGSV